MTARNHSKSEICRIFNMESLGNFFLAFQAFLGFLGNPRIKLKDHHAIKSLQGLQAFLNKKSLEGMEYVLVAFPGNPRIKEEPRVLEIILVRSLIQAFFARKEKLGKHGTFSLDFLGFPGNPRIKEEPGSARNPSCQKLRSFLHIRKSRESMENFLLAFRAFPRIPGKPGELGHSWLFCMCKNAQDWSQKFYPGNSGLLFAGKAPYCFSCSLVKQCKILFISTHISQIDFLFTRL